MKCNNLKLMTANGINVPAFAVLECGRSPDPPDDLEVLLASSFIRTDRRYAVRSSCSAEDHIDTSFAGQFDTYLNVESHDLKEKVRLCLESLHSPGVLEYARQRQLDPHTWEMNVIIQEMIDADLSGILFTANPQGLLNESVIVVGNGLGDMIVSDQADTTEYYFSNTDRVFYYDGKTDFLGPYSVQELIATGERIQDILGYEYLDIEFAIKDDVLSILQARPITTLDDRSPTVFDNSNIVESYPGITLPLTDSFVKMVYAGVFRGIAYRVLKNRILVDAYDAVFARMVGSVNGRIYYEISNWYTVIKFLPFNKRIIPVWQEMLGVKHRTYSNEPVSLSWLQRCRTYINVASEFIRVPSAMERLNQHFNRVFEDFSSSQLTDLSNQELVALYEEIRQQLLGPWDITLLNDMYAFIFTGLLKQRLKRQFRDQYEEHTLEFISGIANIESLKPIRELLTLAQLALTRKESAEYHRRFDDYLKVFGDRAPEELKLESETFRTRPELLIQKVEEYGRDPEKLRQMLNAMERPPGLLVKNPGKFAGFLAKRAMLGIRNREVSRMNRSRIYGMVRSIFLALAANFHRDGLIEESRDIFYLTVDEVFELVNCPRAAGSLIERRKADYAQYAMLPGYSRLVFAGPVFNKKHRSVNAHYIAQTRDRLTGIPCSGGRVTGEVLVIEDVTRVNHAKDRILVTKMTDPGWVFLLASARGIIVEKGSLLSHTAIVSRELKIPSVVGVEGAVEILKTGDLVTMDGHTGIIEIMR